MGKIELFSSFSECHASQAVAPGGILEHGGGRTLNFNPKNPKDMRSW